MCWALVSISWISPASCPASKNQTVSRHATTSEQVSYYITVCMTLYIFQIQMNQVFSQRTLDLMGFGEKLLSKQSEIMMFELVM